MVALTGTVLGGTMKGFWRYVLAGFLCVCGGMAQMFLIVTAWRALFG